MIQASGKVINPQIRQLYATGAAANIVADSAMPPPSEVKPLQSGGRIMFFGTSTNIGFKLSFLPDKPVPTGMVFGYRRKEASYIPLGTVRHPDGSVTHNYPSVFAAIDTSTQMSERYNNAFSVSQVFATGHAAEHFAAERRSEFKQRAREALDIAKELDQRQRDAALEVLRSYSRLTGENRAQAWTDADRLGLFHESQAERGRTLAWLQDPANAGKADAHYTNAIALVDVDDPARLRLLELHRGNLERIGNP